jgi:hypothetical protein
VTIAVMIPAVLLATAALSGAPGAADVGIGASDLCVNTPARPGGSYQPGRCTSPTPAVPARPSPCRPARCRPGRRRRPSRSTAPSATSCRPSRTPKTTLSATPGRSPPDLVSIGYPALLWVIPRHSVSLAPGQGASIPVTLHIPADARHGQYEAALTARTAGAPAPGGGAQALLGAAAATVLKFSVDAAPPDCTPVPPPQPWWAAPPAAGTARPAGWGYIPARDADETAELAGV